MEINLHEKEHKELHSKIWNCKCSPIKEGYCKKCKDDVIKFMEKFGAGVLTNDIKIEHLEKIISKLKKENESLEKRIQEKIKKVEELKIALKS